MNKNKLLIIVLSCLVIIAIIVAAVVISKKPKENVIVDTPTNEDVVKTQPNNNESDWLDDSSTTLNLVDDEEVPDWEYMAHMTENSEIIKAKARYLSSLYRTNDYFRAYSQILGTEFVSNMITRNAGGKEFELPIEYNKVVAFLNVEDDSVYQKISDYLYLGALAQDEHLYYIIVVNTNSDTFVDYSNHFDGFVLGTDNPSVNEYLEKFPDNVVFFIDSNNIIEAVIDFVEPEDLSIAAARIFSGDVPAYKLMYYFNRYHSSLDEALQEYIAPQDTGTYKEYENIGTLNFERSTNYYDFSHISYFKKENNQKNLDISISMEDDRIVNTTIKIDTTNREVVIAQSPRKSDIDNINSEYEEIKNEIVNDKKVTYYGMSENEIYCFGFLINEMYISVKSNIPWNLADVYFILDELY